MQKLATRKMRPIRQHFALHGHVNPAERCQLNMKGVLPFDGGTAAAAEPGAPAQAVLKMRAELELCIVLFQFASVPCIVLSIAVRVSSVGGAVCSTHASRCPVPETAPIRTAPGSCPPHEHLVPSAEEAPRVPAASAGAAGASSQKPIAIVAVTSVLLDVDQTAGQCDHGAADEGDAVVDPQHCVRT